MTKRAQSKLWKLQSWNDGTKRSYPEPTNLLPPQWMPNFPVLGGAYPTASAFMNRNNWARYARMSFCFIPWHPDSEQNYGALATACAGVQALAPASVGATPIHAVYVIHQENYGGTAETGFYGDIQKKLNDENWYLRSSYPSGALVSSGFADNIEINNTGYAHDFDKDANGKSWLEWHAEHTHKLCVTGGAFPFPSGVTYNVSANPNLGAYFIDNVFAQKRVNGDFDLDGQSENAGDADFRASVQRGYRIHADRLRQLSPSIKVTGNIDFYTVEGGVLYNEFYTPDFTKLGDLFQAFDAGWVEQFLNDSGVAYEWAERNNGLIGFWAARNSMRFLHGAVRTPRLNMFNVQDVRFDGSPADNQRLRFAIAFVACCSNGMIHDGGEGSQAHANGFRVTDGSLHPYYTNNGAGYGWLGQPIDETPSWSPYQNGVYMREFTNGFVAVNPRNNGSRNITLGSNVRNIATGLTYTAGQNIPIADRDGLLLLKV